MCQVTLEINHTSISGPGCSKLTSLFVSIAFKFQTLKYANIFGKKNLRSCTHFFRQNIREFGYEVVKHVMS